MHDSTRHTILISLIAGGFATDLRLGVRILPAMSALSWRPACYEGPGGQKHEDIDFGGSLPLSVKDSEDRGSGVASRSCAGNGWQLSE